MKQLRETAYNKRAGKHTFVVRLYTSKGSGKTRAYMICFGHLSVLCEDGAFRKVCDTTGVLRGWVKKVFGWDIDRKGNLLPRKATYKPHTKL